MDAVLTARANATLREEFLRRGLASAEELDQIGFVSHEQLLEWADRGDLAERVAALQESWGLALLKGAAFNARIKRADRGRFGGVVGMIKHDEPKLKAPKSAVPDVPHARRLERGSGPRLRVEAPREPQRPAQQRPIRTLRGRRGPVRNKRFDVYATPSVASPDEVKRQDSTMPEHMSAEQMRQEIVPRNQLHDAGRKRLARLERQARGDARSAEKKGDHATARQKYEEAGQLHKAAADPEQLATHGSKELYDRRTKRLEKRIARRTRVSGKREATPAAGAVGSPAELTAAETDFNDAGKVSQKTLLAFANDAASRPTTAEMYRTSDGVYHPSRAALHAHILDGLMRQRNEDGSISYTNPYLESPGEHPKVLFTGGGYASGKGGVIKKLKAEGRYPKDALLLDPDAIKAELPEFQATAMSDPEANLRVYQEAWDIAQHAMKEAQDRKLNMVVDGITNTHSDEVAARVKSFTDAGYVNPEIHYVSAPTDVAIGRAASRAAKGETAADRRMIPETIMRAVHRDVSATIPGVMSRAAEMGADVHVYDTNQGIDEVTGQPRMAKEVATAHASGQIEHQDSAAFQAILNKANESIRGVNDSTPSDNPVPTPVNTRVDPQEARALGQALQSALPETTNRVAPQPMGDAAGLLELADKKGLPGYKQLLDMGAGIAEALNGTTHDGSTTPFDQIGQEVQQNMDQAHVIIAPVKSLDRSEQKLAAMGHAGDATFLHDALRATVTVPTAHDLPGALQTIVSHAQARGWTVEQVKNRLQGEGDNRMSTGYGDVTLILRAPPEHGGMVSELQVNTNPMWWVKEVGPAHDFYNVERSVANPAQAQARDLLPEEAAIVKAAAQAARPLFDRAWGMAMNGGGGADVAEVIMGDGREVQTTLQQISEQAAALSGATA